jgi:hypothetical protein
LATEDPETVPAGFILLEGGFDFLSGTPFPASGSRVICFASARSA